MKLAQAYEFLHLALVQAQSHQGAQPDRQVSFERAALWYLNQAQDALVAALREHHGLRGQANETATLAELAKRDLPSAAADQLFAWDGWDACRKAMAPKDSVGLIGTVDEDKENALRAQQTGYLSWVEELTQLCDQLQGSYAEF